MTPTQQFALVVAILVALVVAMQRRLIFSWSTIGVFISVNLAVIIAGTLAFPFVRSLAEAQFYYADWSRVSDEDVVRAILVNVGGAALVLLSYHLSHVFASRGKVLRRAPNLLAPAGVLTLGYSSHRVALLSLGALVIGGTLAVMNSSVIAEAFWEGMVGAQYEAVIAGRRAIGSNYAFVLISLNAIPFLGVGLFLTSRIRGGKGLGFLAVLVNLVGTLFLLLLFQKRPLLLLFLCLLLAHIWVRQSRLGAGGGRGQGRSGGAGRRRARTGLLVNSGIGFLGLMGLFYAQTSIGREEETILTALTILVGVVLWNILGGLSLSSIMYAHYFPAVDPHYGLSNIGVLSRLFGFNLYENATEVYRYFNVLKGLEGGSIAVPALMDFYGAWGVIGLCAGAIALGVLLERLDKHLNRLELSAARTWLSIFSFVFAFYLSHASIFNCLLGYGGVIFLALWAVSRANVRFSRLASHNSHRPAPGMAGAR